MIIMYYLWYIIWYISFVSLSTGYWLLTIEYCPLPICICLCPWHCWQIEMICMKSHGLFGETKQSMKGSTTATDAAKTKGGWFTPSIFLHLTIWHTYIYMHIHNVLNTYMYIFICTYNNIYIYVFIFALMCQMILFTRGTCA